MKRFRHALEVAGVRVAFALTRLLPMRLAGAIGAGLGSFAYSVIGVRRDVSVDNITRALGDDAANHGGASAIAKRSYGNLGRSMMEFITFGRLTHEDVRAIVRFEGLEHFDRAIEEGKGAVLFAGHFGNWELLGAAIAAYGYPIHFLVGEQTNHQVDDLMNDLRCKQGIGIISRNLALKKVLRALKANQFVALLADQDARKGGVFVEFMGRPAASARGPALFAIKQGCPIVTGHIRRVDGGGHVATLEPPLYANPALDGDEQVRELTQRFTDQLSSWIRRYPDEYFWAHRRWKTQPDADAPA